MYMNTPPTTSGVGASSPKAKKKKLKIKKNSELHEKGTKKERKKERKKETNKQTNH